RLKIAIQADAHIRADGVCEFHLKKERKISRITEILSNLDLETWQANNLDGTVSVYAKGMNFDGLKSLSWIDLSRITQEDASAMLEEIAEWDATRNRQHSFIYFSTIKENASIVQALSVIAGRQSRIFHRKRDKPRQDMYTVFVGSKNYFLLEKLRKEREAVKEAKVPEYKTGGKPLEKKFEKAMAAMGIKTKIKMRTVNNISMNELFTEAMKKDKKEKAPSEKDKMKKGDALSGKREPIEISPEMNATK
ncbi:hypothetical protein EBR43_11350, partial [bacterium]|nr:hypothetical protein [bacterium]